ncbi:MAG: outer membrane lipoprotein-sorting protein [bacterium]|nr:outer membrane lipoprotein-sorting protein [bacterium]
MQRLTKAIVGSVFLAALAVPATADRIDEIEKELIQAHGKLKSYTAKSRSSYDSGTDDESMYKSNDKGTYEWQRQGELVMYRIETTGMQVVKAGGKESANLVKSTVVCDGKDMYVLSDTSGQKSAIKHKADPRAAGAPAMMFEGLRDQYNLKVLADESVNGQSCYVIEGKAKHVGEDGGNPMVRYVTYVSKEMGVAVKGIGYDADGKTMSASDTTDIKINVPISPERFEFVAPEGVTVVDMAKMMQGIEVPEMPEGSGE